MQLDQKIGRYRVTVDNDMGDGATGCWVEFKTFNASLECLDRTGELESIEGGVHQVERAIIDQIRAWADENGY